MVLHIYTIIVKPTQTLVKYIEAKIAFLGTTADEQKIPKSIRSITNYWNSGKSDKHLRFGSI